MPRLEGRHMYAAATSADFAVMASTLLLPEWVHLLKQV